MGSAKGLHLLTFQQYDKNRGRLSGEKKSTMEDDSSDRIRRNLDFILLLIPFRASLP